jgi:MFS family permease
LLFQKNPVALNKVHQELLMLLAKRLLNIELLNVPLNVWMIGIVTFFKNASSVVLVIYCPLYLTEVVGVRMSNLGLIEGVLESFSFFSRILSGVLSDSMKRRKPLLVVGYLMSLVGRFFLALSSSALGIFVSRSCERLGNGIQASPRDALVGDFARPDNRGACFGLRNSLTVLGSAVSAFLAMLIMSYTANNYTLLFQTTLIPSALATLILIFFVQDSPKLIAKYKTPGAFRMRDFAKDLSALPASYWKVILLSFFVMCGNFGIAFLTKHASEAGLSKTLIPLVMIFQSAATVLVAFPSGRLADRIDRRWVLTLGILMLVIGNGILSIANSLPFVFLGIIFWGLQLGVIQNNLLAFIAQTAPSSVRGTGFGVMQFISGIGTFFANALTGYLWQYSSPAGAFQANMLVAATSLALLWFLVPKPNSKKS